MSKDPRTIDGLKKKAERMKRVCPNLSISNLIIVPTDHVEPGKAFILMNRAEYIRELAAFKESYYAAQTKNP